VSPRRMVRIGVKGGLVVLALVAAYVVVTFLQVWNASNRDASDPAQAIIVLGAAQYDGRPSPVLARRLDHAVELYEAGVAPTIVVTGGKQEGDRFTEAAAGFRYLRDAGVPEADILREEQGDNTWSQLAATTRFLRGEGIRSAVLVSDDYHAYRLDRIAHELGLVAQVSPVDPRLSTGARIRAMTRETVAVAVGRVIGFRRLVDLDQQLSFAEPPAGLVTMTRPPSGMV
jgi:uncharacterized SAM-binding protein YcdF (DUF218 family)